MDPFAGPVEKKPAAVPVGGMRHVHFDGSPESAGAVLWAISQTDRRVYVHAASDELLVLPRALQDVGGDLGRRGDARLGEPVWVPHYDVAPPCARPGAALASAPPEHLPALFDWARAQDEERPEDVLVAHGVAACDAARQVDALVCSRRDCARCAAFARLAEEYGVYLDSGA